MLFQCQIVVILIIIHSINCAESDQCLNKKVDVRSFRKRRHLTFPDGSAVSITISSAKSFLTHVPSGWFMTMDLDVIFPLPDSKFINAHWRRKLHHRQKKELWERIKNTMYLHNFDGHTCLLQSICEAERHLAPPGKSLIHDLLRAVFKAPLDEKDFSEEIGESYQELLDPKFCDKHYDCPFSLLHFVLEFKKGKY